MMIWTQGRGTINENSGLLIEFYLNNKIMIGGIVFPHKVIHKTTWNSPDIRTKNQIDHVTIHMAVRSTPCGKRGRGRPAGIWRIIMKEDLKTIG